MKQRTINHLLAMLCMLILGIGNAMAGTLRVAQDGLTEFKMYDSDVTDIRIPNQAIIDGKSTGTLSYDSNAHKLIFNGVHRKSVTKLLKPFFDYDETLTIELKGENELTIEQAYELDAKIFNGNIKIIGDGSLKLNLTAYGHYRGVGAVKKIDMQGTGVVEINLINAYTIEETYAATAVHLEEGMMLSTSQYFNENSATGVEPPETRVFRKEGGLDYYRQDEPWYSNDAWYYQQGARWLRIEPLKKYNLYVAGKQVNWINMTDILGDGHVSYDPTIENSGGGKGQITLNNADIHYEYDGSNMPRIFEHSSVSDDANHVIGVHATLLDVELIGHNKITGVVNSPLDSKTPFFGFPKIVRLYGNGTLRMELSADAAAAGGVYGFNNLGAQTSNTVYLKDSFTGWVSVSTSNVGTNPASVFMNKALYLALPDNSTYTDYFIAGSNTLPVVARANVSQQNMNLNVAHVNFGKKDGSATPTGTINSLLTQTTYVGNTLADNTLGLSVTGGQAPFYYSATGLQDGLSINPENGYVSGTYTTANTPASDAQTTLTVTDFQGRQTSVSVAKQEVAEKLTINGATTVEPEWARGIAIEQINLSEKISGGLAPYTYKVLNATTVLAVTPLPAGVLLDTSTGIISGTPTAKGTYKCAIEVTDALGQKAGVLVQGNVAENYGFKVAGVLVTGHNKDNILAVAKPQDYVVSQGKISFNPTTKKLTLDRFKVVFATEDNATFINILNNEIPFDGQTINVHVKGDCSIKVGNMPNEGDESEFIFPYNHSITVTGENSGSEAPKLTLGATDGSLLDAVDGDVVVNGNVLLDFSTFSIPINGNLTIPADQVVYVNDLGNPVNGGTPGDGTYTYNIGDNGDAKHIVTAPHPNGALCFTNEKEGNTIYNTVPVKPFAMFGVKGGVAPYSYSATSLPSGLAIDAETGYISGTSSFNNSNTTVTFTVTDAMRREINTDMNLTLKNPTLTVTAYGGSKGGHSTDTYSWTTVANASSSLEGGQILLVESDFNFEETLLDIPNNVVVRDVNKNTYTKNITLKDGVNYTFPYDVEAKSISYTRTFQDVIVNNWQCLYVPFDITVTDKLLADFEFAELYMISQKDENNNGEIEDDEPLVMKIMKLNEGKTLHANTPYFIKAKSSGAKMIEVENAKLHQVANGTVNCSTTKQTYTLTGIYQPKNINGYYTMNIYGQYDYYNIDINLGSNRWYMEVQNRNGYSVVEARPIMIWVDGEDDPTGIIDYENSSSTKSIYNLNGMKMNDAEKLPRGIYIMNGKKVLVK